MILMMKEYISSWGEVKFSVFISTSAADCQQSYYRRAKSR